MGGVCGAAKDSAAGEESPELKLQVLVVKVAGLPADKVLLEDRSIFLSVRLPDMDMDMDIDQRMTNVIDPFFNMEFQVPATTLIFKVMEEVAGSDVALLGQATLDAGAFDSWAGDLELKDGTTSGAIIRVKVRAEEFGYPEDLTTAETTVIVDNPKKTKNLGIDVDITEESSCYVYNVKAKGLVDKHNKSQAEESSKLQAGAFIVAYNGVAGDPKSIEAAMKKAAPTAEFTIRPTETFRIALDKSSGDVLGVDVPRKSVGNSVLIAFVKESGFVAKWNEEHPEQEVKKGDRIVEVNGKKGTGKELVDMIKRAPNTYRVILTIIRMAQ